MLLPNIGTDTDTHKHKPRRKRQATSGPDTAVVKCWDAQEPDACDLTSWSWSCSGYDAAQGCQDRRSLQQGVQQVLGKVGGRQLIALHCFGYLHTSMSKAQSATRWR